MARTQIKTVRLERQPHYDAVERLRLAYQRLMAAANQAAPPAETKQKTVPTIQEVKSCR
jgi:hypothetical protein